MSGQERFVHKVIPTKPVGSASAGEPRFTPDRAGAPAISLKRLRKEFGDVVAVDDVDLDIADGEFFSMLGPVRVRQDHGAAADRRLRAPTAGTVELDGEDVTGTPPFDRDVNTVFQDYALFPHMCVLDNVAYGLRVSGSARPSAGRRAEEALATRPARAATASRRPRQLSGGQRQRVALARALVVRPKVLLLDEPLGALDLKLREQMQVELKELQRELGITFVFVTHDQEEALTHERPDRGVQRGPDRAGRHARARSTSSPATPFVAGFVGTSNLFDGRRSPGSCSAEPARSASGPRRSAAPPATPTPAPRRRSPRRHRHRGRLPRHGDPLPRRPRRRRPLIVLATEPADRAGPTPRRRGASGSG